MKEWDKLSFFEQELLTRMERIGYTIGGIGEDGFFVRTENSEELIAKLRHIEMSLDSIVTALDEISNKMQGGIQNENIS